MAYIQCNFWSEVLGKYCDMTVLLPQRAPLHPEKRRGKVVAQRKFPVLYLLHGLGGDHRSWTKNTVIEQLTNKLNIAVVMPNGERGFYTDMVQGAPFGKFFSDELPEIAASMFPISTKREDTYIAGASMGGFGALRLALSVPERFCAVFALSPLINLPRAIKNGNSRITPTEMERIFGSPKEQENSANNLFKLAEQVKAAGNIPEVAIHCGTSDYLYQDSADFCRHLRNLKWNNLQYSLDEPGTHGWEYWSRKLPELLNFCTNQVI